MDTDRRLKAARVPVGAFLGDMTNFISDVTVPIHYLLGLLNSRVLNRRIKLTSTNNYLSAAEIEALPIPRIGNTVAPGITSQSSGEELRLLIADPADSIPGWLERIEILFDQHSRNGDAVSIPRMIETGCTGHPGRSVKFVEPTRPNGCFVVPVGCPSPETLWSRSLLGDFIGHKPARMGLHQK